MEKSVDVSLVMAIAERHGRHLSWEEAEFVLWEYTPFPFGSDESVKEALDVFFAPPAEVVDL